MAPENRMCFMEDQHASYASASALISESDAPPQHAMRMFSLDSRRVATPLADGSADTTSLGKTCGKKIKSTYSAITRRAGVRIYMDTLLEAQTPWEEDDRDEETLPRTMEEKSNDLLLEV